MSADSRSGAVRRDLKRPVAKVAVLALLAAALATSWTPVAPGEVVLIRRLGRILDEPWTPGAHFAWPFGIDRPVRVRLGAVRVLAIGVRAAGEAPGAGEYLTGDQNLAVVAAVVQYRVADPRAYVIAAESRVVEDVLRGLAEAGLTRALSRGGIDAILRAERAEVAHDAADDLTRGVERAGLGLAILGVNLTETRPPDEVADDFAKAASARNARDQSVLEARGRAQVNAAAARAEGEARLEHARADSERLVTLAKARVGAFESMLGEYRRDPARTVSGLYADTIKRLWPRLRRSVIMTPDEPLDLSIFGTR